MRYYFLWLGARLDNGVAAMKRFVTINHAWCGFILCLGIMQNGHAQPLPSLHNQLAGNPSAYLAMHADDPVLWQSWDELALQRARSEKKLIFISIGYFSCHWCHVMQKESYQDTEVAAILNRYYIPIKVDRELFPALDARLIEFVERTRGSAGWPLNVVLTPDGYPLIGMTYLPKTEFMQTLARVREQWQVKANDLRQTAKAATLELEQASAISATDNKSTLSPEQRWTRASALFVQQALGQADTLLGGFGQQAKFPMVSHLNALMDVNERQENKEVADFLRLSLEQMAGRNLRDALGGGFFRYTVDPDWQTPHFEKMLYDNAMLAALYLRAASALKRDDFTVIAFQTLDFMVANMQVPDGGMVSSFSAVDSQRVEGGYYLWQSEQIRQLLNDQQFKIVYTLWRMDQPSAFDAGYLPHIAIAYDEAANRLKLPLQIVVDESVAASKIVFQQRKLRELPVDNKRLAGWNGLALKSLALALIDLKAHGVAANSQRYQKYLAAARGIRRYLHDKLWVDGELWRAASDQGKKLGQASLEDYAFVAEGLFYWLKIESDKAAAELLTKIHNAAWRGFYSKAGWQQSAKSLLPLRLGVAALEDGALPSASSVLIDVTQQMAAGNRNSAKSAIKMAEQLVLSEPFNYPSLIHVLAPRHAINP